MIKSIGITNWKTHRKTTLGFQKGVNVLIGVMGAGKSSTMDAISFGLFGTFPALLSKRVSLAGLVTNRPRQEAEAEVRLAFDANGSDYVVTRKVGGSSNTARLEKDGAHLQTQPTKVTEEIEAALKIDYDTFSRAVYAEQNRLDYFLDLPKGERKRQIDHMLGLDTFATAEENCTSLVNSMREGIKYEDNALAQVDIKSIRSQLKALAEEGEAREGEQKALGERERAARKSSDETKAELERLRKEMQRKKLLEEEATKLSTRVSTLNAEMKKIDVSGLDGKQLARRQEELTRLEKSMCEEQAALKKRERFYQKSVADAEAAIRENEAKARERDKIIRDTKDRDEAQARRELEREDAALQELMGGIAAKDGRRAETREWLKELNRHVGTCPVCERELDEQMRKRLVEQKGAALASIEAELKSAERLKAEKAARIKELKDIHNRLVLAASRLADYKDVDKALARAQKEREESAKALSDSSARLQGMDSKIENAREELRKLKSGLDAVERRVALALEVDRGTALLEQRRKELASITVDDKRIEGLEDARSRQSAELAGIAERLDGTAKEIARIAKDTAARQRDADGFAEMERRIERRRGQVANLNKFKAALVDTEATLRNRLVGSINSLMAGLWGQLYPYGDYAGLRLDAKKDDYLLQLDTGAGTEEAWAAVDSIASGGERSIACLTMRIALAMVIVPNLRWLILDEPTHNLDASGISKLIDVLGNTLPNIVEQIFIITHDDSLRQISSARVYQFSRDKAANEPTSASQV